MTPTHKYNTFGKRLLAGIIDAFVFIPFSIANRHIENIDNKNLFIVWTLFYIICWTMYVVIGHGKYGQTIGKRLMNIKVFDINEQDVIGYKRAFFREAVWFFSNLIGITYFAATAYQTGATNKELDDKLNTGFIGLTMSIWFMLELVTMFLNSKRRALHDFIAGSVVIDVNEMKREELQRRHQELLDAIRNK